MLVRPLIARAIFAVSRYRLVSETPPAGSMVAIGAPHTSNWDFVLMFAICWRHHLRPKWLGKHQLFKPPFGWLMRALGGIPVDRGNPAGLVDGIVASVRDGGPVVLVIAPEGTRGRGDRWKSGFYRIARDAGLPIVLGYVDSASRTTGLGPAIHVSGDVTADMDRIRHFYADKRGIHPAGFTPPWISEEGARPAS